MDRKPVQIATIVSRPFQENTYIAWLPDHTDCLVIDPGLEPDLILEFLDKQRLTPSAILNTHGHTDHIAGNEALKARFPRDAAPPPKGPCAIRGAEAAGQAFANVARRFLRRRDVLPIHLRGGC